jgi:hypothetical protein
MSEMGIRRALTSPFRRTTPLQPRLSERIQFQVLLRLMASEPADQQELETMLMKALDRLTEEARGVVFGPVGGVDFTENAVELEFTIETISPAVLYAKMGEVLRVLEHAGFEFESSKEERLEGELLPA